MSVDHTQQQSAEDRERAKALSLVRMQPPAEAPGYTMERFLGAGAYGEVWIAVDQNTGRRVAIKFFTSRGAVDWPLMAREVEKLVYLSAERSIVQLLDVGWEAEPPFYVMEYIPHGSLDDLLRQHGPLPWEESLRIFEDLAVALVKAHGKGILHCDLKPANVLLDEDRKPILADFGQARLTGELRPALGTFFFMAPEQAQPDSIPDAQWDVYALGALLYTMLTGQPPHRTEAALKRIEGGATLPERLDRYRQLVRQTAPPTAHRRVRGLDRPLSHIIERCLGADPRTRFPNVQAVLEELHTRKLSRSQLPLRLLGLVGPVLFLLIAALFGYRGYQFALRDSERFISARAGESNDFAAKFAARSIEAEIARYFRLANREAEQAELREHVREVLAWPGLPVLDQMPGVPDPDEGPRKEFLELTQRLALHDYLETRLGLSQQRLASDPLEPKLASMFVVGPQGTMLAVAYDQDTETRSVGRNYAWRTYFHGGPVDLPPGVRPPAVKPIEQTHLSAVFRSTTTGYWKVAITTPIVDQTAAGHEVLGVLALTVDLGDFAFFRTNKSSDRFAVLVDVRQGPLRGTILQHPRFDAESAESWQQLAHYSSPEFRIPEPVLQQFDRQGHLLYADPLAHTPGGSAFEGSWIAAGERVRLPNDEGGTGDMLVLVQEKYSAATAPLQRLGARLLREGSLALCGVILVIVGLWYFVLRVLDRPRGPLVLNPPAGGLATIGHSSTTAPRPTTPGSSTAEHAP